MKKIIAAILTVIVVLVGWLFVGAKKASADEPRWGHIKYDTNRVEYILPRCQQSKIKNLRITKDDKAVTVRLECDPVPGETNRPNPDISK